jgi:hypothetical protein
MLFDTPRLAATTAELLSDVAVDLRGRMGRPLWIKCGHLMTRNIVFCGYMSIGHDVENPDEDVAVELCLAPEYDNLNVTIALGTGMVLAESDISLKERAGDEIEAAIAEAKNFLDAHLHVIVETLSAMS